jgi:hypothetical protein
MGSSEFGIIMYGWRTDEEHRNCKESRKYLITEKSRRVF